MILERDYMFCMGDLNINLLNSESTRRDSMSLIDVIVLQDASLVVSSGVEKANISDHELIYCETSDVRSLPDTPDFTYCISLKNVNYLDVLNPLACCWLLSANIEDVQRDP